MQSTLKSTNQEHWTPHKVTKMKTLSLNPSISAAPTRDHPHEKSVKTELPPAKEVKVHPEGTKEEGNAGIYFVGTATTVL